MFSQKGSCQRQMAKSIPKVGTSSPSSPLSFQPRHSDVSGASTTSPPDKRGAFSKLPRIELPKPESRGNAGTLPGVTPLQQVLRRKRGDMSWVSVPERVRYVCLRPNPNRCLRPNPNRGLRRHLRLFCQPPGVNPMNSA